MRLSGERQRYGAGAALAWAGQPGTLAGLAVLVVNDHLLKQAWPGLVTGKLSDLAGMLVAPPLLALAFSWLRGRSSDRQALLALLATGVGFALAKTSAQGAEFASGLWSLTGVPSRMVADPTDLIAVPALGLAWLCWRSARARPAAEVGARRVRALVVVPLLIAGTVATSDTQHGPVIASLARSQGRIYWVHAGYVSGTRPFALVPESVTDDGGRTWQELPFTSPPLGSGDARRATSEDCDPASPRHCFRIGGPQRPLVQETTDGGATWRTAWQLTPGRMYYRNRALVTASRAEGSAFGGSRALLVARVPDGLAVLVDDGADGLVLRDPAGHWTRPALPFTDKPVPLTGIRDVVEPEIGLSLVWGLLCGFVVWRTVQWRIDGRGSRGGLIGYGLAGFAALAVLETAAGSGSYSPPFSGPTLFVLILLVGLVIAVLIGLRNLINSTNPPPETMAGERGVVAIPLAFPVVVGLVLWPFLGWAEGFPDSFVVACWLAVGGAVLGFSGSILLGLELARRPAP